MLMIQKNPYFQKGTAGVLVMLGIVIIAAFAMIGGFSSRQQTSQSLDSSGSPASYTCCDSGDGDDCKVSGEQKFTWKGTNAQLEEYALLKSDIALAEGAGHIAPASTPYDKTPAGERIFLNTTSQTFPNGYPNKEATCPGGKDFVFGKDGCVGIPDDEIIYVCKSDCQGKTGKGIFDAYYRTKDGTIPDVIKNCVKPKSGSGGGRQEIIISPGDSKSNLQLRSFEIVEKLAKAKWLSPYCKPAIYLYPEKEENIHVKIAPKGDLTYTIPPYPLSGWNVLAKPNGEITYNNDHYDYLYYEAEIPDSEINKPKEGFVVEKNKINSLLNTILPKLSLNKKEADQFTKYWLSVLPDSPFYFVGIVSTENLNSIAPLSISPKPDTVIRVTLYFEALENKISLPQPKITPIKRQGFTVVEWGGIFKSDKNHNFSCFQ